MNKEAHLGFEPSWDGLMHSAYLVRPDWSHSVRKKLFQDYKQVTKMSAQNITLR